MKTARLAIIMIFMLLIAVFTTQAAVWSSADPRGSWLNGGYTMHNNVWGNGYGRQTIWANSYSKWGVWSDHPKTDGIKSYPNCEKVVNKKISALGKCVSSFNCNRPSSGAYTTAYKIWCDNSTYQIMLWMNKQGAVMPPGTSQGKVTVGGHSWTVYKGSNGSNQIYSFLRTSNTNSGTVNIKDILNWIKNIKKWFGDVTLSKVQVGWEITSSTGGMNFQMNNYSISF